MALTIAILEDDSRRRLAMDRRLTERLWMYDVVYFDMPHAFCRWLERNSERVLFASLDHDMNRVEDCLAAGDDFQIGNGYDASEWLARRRPAFPVILHTSNAPAAARMESLLREAGWRVEWIVPAGDLEWIDREWMRAVERAALVETTEPPPDPVAG